MSIKVVCSSCGKKVSAPDSAAGKRIRCPHCKAVQRLPEMEQPVDAMELGLLPEVQADEPPPIPEDPFAGFDASSEPYRMAIEPPAYVQTAASVGVRQPPRDTTPQRLDYQPRAKRASQGNDDELSGGEWVVALLCSGLGLIFGLIWVIQGKSKGKKMLGVSFMMNFVWFFVRQVINSAK